MRKRKHKGLFNYIDSGCNLKSETSERFEPWSASTAQLVNHVIAWNSFLLIPKLVRYFLSVGTPTINNQLTREIFMDIYMLYIRLMQKSWITYVVFPLAKMMAACCYGKTSQVTISSTSFNIPLICQATSECQICSERHQQNDIDRKFSACVLFTWIKCNNHCEATSQVYGEL